MIEDDRTDREIYKQCLTETMSPWFELAEAESAAGGMELARTFDPDCVLLDYNLPDRNGLEVLGQWNHENRPTAIVMLTAFGGEDLAVQAMKAGVTDYLPKRLVTAESLARAVANATQKVHMKRRIEEQRLALERSGKRYEMLLEAMPQMVWTASAEGQVQYANRRWLEYTGLAVENAGQLGWDDVLHPADNERTQDTWKSATLSRSIFEIEHRLRRAADNLYRWHLVRAVPMKNDAGEVTSWFGTCTEVENQKQAERATREEEKREVLGVMAGGIAHDFNNLLTSILGNASLALGTLPADHLCREDLEDVIRAAEKAAELTRKLLWYSGHGDLIRESVDAGGLARETCALLRRALPRHVQLLFEGASQLALVVTDSAQLRQVIVELVRNAVEAIGDQPGVIWVRTRMAEGGLESASPEQSKSTRLDTVQLVAVEVQDTGCGMDDGTKAKIFDPFFSTKFTGRGMGLSAVQGFVRSNGGAIQVDSRPREGSIFRIVLPTSGKGHPRTSIGNR